MPGPTLFRRIVQAFQRPAAVPPAPARRRLVPVTKDGKLAVDLPVYTWSEWDSVDRVKAALVALDTGHFLPAAQLCDAMLRDDRIAGVLRTRVNGLLGLPVDVDTGDKDNQKIANEVRDGLREWCPKPEVKRLLRSGIMLGVGLGQLAWDTSDTEQWTPRMRWWHPQFLQWRWDTRSYWVQTMGGQIEIAPGDGQWVLYAPDGEQLGWLDAMVRSLAIPWLVRQWARRDWARYSEVHGLPIRVGIVPAKADNDDKERFVQELAQLGSESVIRTPQGSEDGSKFDVKLLEASSASWEGFQALLNKTDVDIAVAALGQNLTTEAGTGTKGSLATAQVHADIKQDVIESDGDTLSDCLHKQVVQVWSAYNFGGDPNAAPRACFHTEPPQDLGSKAAVMQTVGNALTSMRKLRIPVDVQQVCTDFSIPVVEGDGMPDFTEEPEEDPDAPEKPGKPGGKEDDDE